MASRKKPKVKAKARHPARKAKVPTSNNSQLPSGYIEVLEDIKERVRTARIQASLSVNRELVILYWEIGHLILKRQEAEGWGTKVIDRFSIDLNREFPDQKGFSARNLKYMRKFAESYHAREIVQQAAAQIPWFHNCTILDKVQDTEQRQWLQRIEKQLLEECVFEREDFDRGAFKSKGGFDKINKVFQGNLTNVLDEINNALYPDERNYA